MYYSSGIAIARFIYSGNYCNISCNEQNPLCCLYIHSKLSSKPIKLVCYLPFVQQSKYPAPIEPPASNGCIVRSWGPGRHWSTGGREVNAPNNNTDVFDNTLLTPTPMTSLAFATHKIGCAIALPSCHLALSSTGQTVTSPHSTIEECSMTSEAGGFSEEMTPIAGNLSAFNKTFATDLSYSFSVPQHSSPKGKNPFSPLFAHNIGSPAALSALNPNIGLPEKIKHHPNPYGNPDGNHRKGISLKTIDKENDFWEVFDHSNVAVPTYPSLRSHKGTEPRFTNVMRAKWAHICRNFHRIRQRRSRAVLTARELQRDVKTNEEQMLFSIAALRDNFVLSQASPHGTADETFELGPVTVPLKQITIPSPLKLKSVGYLKCKQRKEWDARRSRKKKSKFKFMSKTCKVPKPEAEKIMNSFGGKSETNVPHSSYIAATAAARISTTCQGKVQKCSRKQAERSLNIHKSASENNLSDDEEFSENNDAIFDDLFAKAFKRSDQID